MLASVPSPIEFFVKTLSHIFPIEHNHRLLSQFSFIWNCSVIRTVLENCINQTFRSTAASGYLHLVLREQKILPQLTQFWKKLITHKCCWGSHAEISGCTEQLFQHFSWLHSVKCTELYSTQYGHVTGMHWQALFKLSQCLTVKPSLTLKPREGWCILTVLVLVCWSGSFHAVFPGPGETEELRQKKRHCIFLVYLFVHKEADIFDTTLI